MKHALVIRLITLGLLYPASCISMADDTDTAEVDEIIVSATRREESVMEIPQSVQAIPRQTLSMPIYRDVTDVYNLVPGATTAITQGGKPPSGDGIMLRGAGITMTNAGGGSQPVGYYIDDIPFIDINTMTPPPLGTFDLDQIEVLRGPQGTTYGQDSSAGSVIMRTAPVNLSESGYLVRSGMMSYAKGGDMGLTYGGVVNVPIVEDKLGIRISYLSETDPGHGVVQGRPEVDYAHEEERVTMRTKLTYMPTDSVELTLTHSEWETDYYFLPGTSLKKSDEGTMEVAPIGWDFGLEVFPDGIFRNKNHTAWTTALAKMDLGFAELTYSYGDVEVKTRDGNQEDFNYGIVTISNTPSNTQTHEIRMVSQSDGPLGWIVGYMDFESEGQGDVFYNFATFGDYAANSESYQSASALYGELTYDISESITVFGGLRTHDEDALESGQDAMRAEGDPVRGPYTGFVLGTNNEPYSHDNTSYRFGVEWAPQDNGLVYVSRSTASRAPIRVSGANLVALTEANLTGLIPEDATELVSTEIGTKWTLNDGDLKLELVYALGQWEDLVMRAGLNIPSALALPMGQTDAEVTSIEVSVEANLTDNLSLTYAGGFTDTEVTAIPDPTVVTGFPGAVKVGGELYNYSPTTHSLSLNYQQELTNGSQMYVSGTYASRSKINAFSTLASVMGDLCCYKPAPSGYKNLSLSAGVRRDSWDFNVSLTNATDFDGMYGMVFSEGAPGLISMPRAIHLQVTYDNL